MNLTVSDPEDDFTLPRFAIRTNGTAVSVDGESIPPLCAAAYTQIMDSRAKAMGVQVDQIIGSELCAWLMPGELLINSVTTFVMFFENMVSKLQMLPI